MNFHNNYELKRVDNFHAQILVWIGYEIGYTSMIFRRKPYHTYPFPILFLGMV